MSRLDLSRPRETRRAFTLIELLIVIVILGILAGISLTIANRVTAGARSRSTEDVIRSLDQILTTHLSTTGSKAPSFYTDPLGNVFPIVDARYRYRAFPMLTAGVGIAENQSRLDRDLDPPQPTTTLLLLAISGGDTTAMLQGLDPKFIETSNVSAYGWATQTRNFTQFMNDATAANPGPRGPVVKDAWGRPIRFVHPEFDGGSSRFFDGTVITAIREWIPITHVYSNGATAPEEWERSYRAFINRETPASPAPYETGDADEGVCQGSMPYFYSAGLDGDPGYREDNVYTTKPAFPPETAKFKFD